MKVAIWDTYASKEDGSTMHFDIVVPESLKNEQTIHNFGREYLGSKRLKVKEFCINKCEFCHIESATPEMELSIHKKGYYIIEMENC